MRIASWNVNSLKARLPIVLDWCRAGSADILLLQELKLTDEAMPVEAFGEIGWHCLSHGQKTYNGVAILSKYPIREVQRGLPLLEDSEADEQARWLEAEIEGLHLASLYLPNGNPRPGPKFDYKLSWMERLIRHAATLIASEKRVILGGDYNIIPRDSDCWDPAVWADDALARPDSRAAFNALKWLGLTEAFEQVDGRGHQYSFYDYQGGAWQKGHGIRIDHLLLSPQAADRLKSVEIHRKTRGEQKASDHVPVLGVFDL